DFRVREVFEVERGAAAQPLDFLRRFGRDLHQPAGAGGGGLVAEVGLRVDDGGDQRGVDALLLRLLANDVLVLERQGPLLARAADQTRGDRDRDRDARQGRSGREDQTAAAPPATHPLSLSISADRARSRSSGVPSLAIAWSARSAFSSWLS